jgi:hypothetical protein
MHFCTYFDFGYLAKGLAMHRSLLRHCPEAKLHVLALDETCASALADMALAGVSVTRLHELEAAVPGLATVRSTRSTIEYYFTCTPVLLHYLLARIPAGECLTYLDADLFFFSSPAPLMAALEGHSVGLIEHRFPESHSHLLRHGRFNVGWVSARHDRTGMDFARWWEGRCLDWCYDIVEAHRYADQKYLDQVPQRFPDVRVLTHPGANLAPWNLGRHAVGGDPSLPTSDGQAVIFFHFNGVKNVRGRLYLAKFTGYCDRVPPAVLRFLYSPYVAALAQSDAQVAAWAAGRTGASAVQWQRRGPSAISGLQDWLVIAKHCLAGDWRLIAP